MPVPFGPLPAIKLAEATGFVLQSRHLERPHTDRVDWFIHGHLNNPLLCRSASALLTNLWQSGRLQPLAYGDTEVASVALNEEFHPINMWGRPTEKIWLFGSLTEGVRYFTHYVPSPKSRLRAFLDAQQCVERILGYRR